MATRAASRFDPLRLDGFDGVATRHQLALLGIGPDDITAQCQARRWQVAGSAVLLHNGAPTREQRWTLTRANCGPRAVLTSFTAAESSGLQGWTRDEVHVLAPAGTTRPEIRGLVLHRTGDWSKVRLHPARSLHALAPALILAASSFRSPRPACGVLAAAVTQRLVTVDELVSALEAATRARHRRVLCSALGDIGQGAQALSEIDFGRLCRQHRLPEPTRQAVRVEPGGRRRYLAAEWRLPDGRIVAVEIDGAFHLDPRRWIDDQLRQNEIVIGGTLVLRFPSVLLRVDPQRVMNQLARALRSRS